MALDLQTCVQVLYDFDYVTDDGRGVSIYEGEELLLIRKTNDDWWQVIRDGDKRPFYAPMSYLSVSDDCAPASILTSDLERDLNANTVLPQPNKPVNHNEMVLFVSNPLYEESPPMNNHFKEDHRSGSAINSKRGGEFLHNGVKEQAKADGITVIHIPGPTSLNLNKTNEDEGNHSDENKLNCSISEDDYESIDDDGTKSTDSAYNERLQKVAEEENCYETLDNEHFSEESLVEESENPIYANFPLMTSATPPQPTKDDRPVKFLFNHWSEYLDDRGRKFYFNSLSKETTWKPPRRLNDGTQSGEDGSQDLSLSDSTPSSLLHLELASPSSPSLSSDHLEPPIPQQQPPTPPKKPKPKLVKSRHWSKGDDNYQMGGANTSSSTDSLDSPSTPPILSSQHLLSSSSLPRGWSQFADQNSGENYYMHKKTKEKWFSSLDDSGRTYYYAENSAESFWELPKASLSLVSSSGNSGATSGGGFGHHRLAPQPPPASSSTPTSTTSSSTTTTTPTVATTPTSSGPLTSPSGSLPVAPPTVPPSHMLRSPKHSSRRGERGLLSSAERKTKTHSVLVEPSWQPPTGGSNNNNNNNSGGDKSGGKSASLPRGMAPPGSSAGKMTGGATGTIGEHQPRQWPQLQDGCMVVTKQGTLNKSCLSEGGRRLKKHWTQAHVTLTHLYLLFYKDIKAAQQFQLNGNCKPEITVDLAGALIKWSAENSRRKNVFEITTVLGQQILLQDDNDQNSIDWFEAIKSVVIKLPSNSIWSSAVTASIAKEKNKKSGPLSRKKSTKQKNNESTTSKSADSGGGVNNSTSPGSSSHSSGVGGGAPDENNTTSPTERKRRIRDKLRHFFLRRPSMESLREKGIIKDEPVFGCHLHHLCLREKSTVPKFVQLCIEAIERKDMSADGLYRASGNLSQVQKIRFQVNQDDYGGLKTEEDVHVLTGALKMFFRDMKEPLFTFDTFDNFLAAISINDRTLKLASITELVRNLPKPNGDTLKFLLKHLVRVTKLSDKNRMHVQNVAIVFGPTLLWPFNESSDLALDMMHQNQIIELLLLEFNGIFR